jgi:hypothetical protein
VLAEFDVGILPFRDVLVGEEVLLGQGLVEFLQHLARVDQGFEPGALDEMLFVALPADAVNEVIIQGSVFIGMLQFNYSVKYFGKDQDVAAYTLPSATNATCCGTPPSSARPSGKAPTS